MRTRWPIGTLSPPNWRSDLGKLRNAQTVCRYSDTACTTARRRRTAPARPRLRRRRAPSRVSRLFAPLRPAQAQFFLAQAHSSTATSTTRPIAAPARTLNRSSNPHSRGTRRPRRPIVPRFPPLEAFRRRPSVLRHRSRMGRRPKPFTIADRRVPNVIAAGRHPDIRLIAEFQRKRTDQPLVDDSG